MHPSCMPTIHYLRPLYLFLEKNRPPQFNGWKLVHPKAWILHQQGRKDSFYLQLVPDDAPWRRVLPEKMFFFGWVWLKVPLALIFGRHQCERWGYTQPVEFRFGWNNPWVGADGISSSRSVGSRCHIWRAFYQQQWSPTWSIQQQWSLPFHLLHKLHRGSLKRVAPLTYTLKMEAWMLSRFIQYQYSWYSWYCTNYPSREVTYPTWGKGKLFSKVIFDGIC